MKADFYSMQRVVTEWNGFGPSTWKINLLCWIKLYNQIYCAQNCTVQNNVLQNALQCIISKVHNALFIQLHTVYSYVQCSHTTDTVCRRLYHTEHGIVQNTVSCRRLYHTEHWNIKNMVLYRILYHTEDCIIKNMVLYRTLYIIQNLKPYRTLLYIIQNLKSYITLYHTEP